MPDRSAAGPERVLYWHGRSGGRRTQRALIMNHRIRDIFSEVPATYERVNQILTLGLDTLWRRRAVRATPRRIVRQPHTAVATTAE